MALSLASCEKDKGDKDEPVLGDVIEFKDSNFLKALLTVQKIMIYDASADEWVKYFLNVDANNDGLITVSEAQTVKGLDLTGLNVSEIPEIKYFTALIYFNCKDNMLTSLDLSNNTSLTYLDCGENQLTSLDLSGCTALVELHCGENQLTSLDLSGCAALTELQCYMNQITSLDLSKNRILENFYPVRYVTDIDMYSACPLKSLMLYKYHLLSIKSMEILETAYPELEITYVE